MVFANQFHVFHEEARISFFCMANSFRHEIVFWLEDAEAEGFFFKQKNYHPSNPWCCLINSVKSTISKCVIRDLQLGWRRITN